MDIQDSASEIHPSLAWHLKNTMIFLFILTVLMHLKNCFSCFNYENNYGKLLAITLNNSLYLCVNMFPYTAWLFLSIRLHNQQRIFCVGWSCVFNKGYVADSLLSLSKSRLLSFHSLPFKAEVNTWRNTDLIFEINIVKMASMLLGLSNRFQYQLTHHGI